MGRKRRQRLVILARCVTLGALLVEPTPSVSAERILAPYVLPRGAETPPPKAPTEPPAPSAPPREPSSPSPSPPPVTPPVNPLTKRPTPPPANPPASSRVLAPCERSHFPVHPVHRFQCFPDPVRGGTFCAERGVRAEVIDRAACERECRRGGPACPPAGAEGAACARCVERCGAPRLVACAPEQHGTPEGDGCRVDAGAWGNAEPVVVPAACAPPAP